MPKRKRTGPEVVAQLIIVGIVFLVLGLVILLIETNLDGFAKFVAYFLIAAALAGFAFIMIRRTIRRRAAKNVPAGTPVYRPSPTDIDPNRIPGYLDPNNIDAAFGQANDAPTTMQIPVQQAPSKHPPAYAPQQGVTNVVRHDGDAIPGLETYREHRTNEYLITKGFKKIVIEIALVALLGGWAWAYFTKWDPVMGAIQGSSRAPLYITGALLLAIAIVGFMIYRVRYDQTHWILDVSGQTVEVHLPDNKWLGFRGGGTAYRIYDVTPVKPHKKTILEMWGFGLFRNSRTISINTDSETQSGKDDLDDMIAVRDFQRLNDVIKNNQAILNSYYGRGGAR